MTGRMIFAGMLCGALGGAGCLPAPDSTPEVVECETTSDCNTGAGEICDVGVCWGNPPAGDFSAILVPPPGLAPDGVMTGVPGLVLGADGWIHDGLGGSLALDPGVVLTGRVTIPCPASVPTCEGRLPLAGTIKWSRPSGIEGGPKLTGSAMVAADGTYQLAVTAPRGDVEVTMTLAFAPAQTAIATGLPSPAMLMAPYTAELTIDADDIDERIGKVTHDLALDPAALRRVLGHMSRPSTAPLAGWQLQAEVVLEGTAGARQRVSTLAITDANGDFELLIAPGFEVADVVCSPPTSATPVGESRPSVRAHDVVLTGAGYDLMVPQLGAPTPVTFDITGTDSSGGTLGVDGARVMVRLAHVIGNGIELELETQAITTGGFATLPLFPVLDGLPLQYTVDVLPGPTSELASQYGVQIEIGQGPTTIALARRRSLVGTVLDADGLVVAGATVVASLSTSTLCALDTNESRLARSLASTQVASNAKGEFTLFVDNELAGTPLSYDVSVRPATGDGRPPWRFVELQPAADGNRVELQLPDAARVRGVVLSHGPVEGAALSLYQQVAGALSCAPTIGVSGTAVLRGLATTDATGTAAIVLPRP